MNGKFSLSLFLAAIALVGATSLKAGEALEAACETEALVRAGDTVVLIGDSITEMGVTQPWGYYHVLTNALPKVNFIALGYGGTQVKSWIEMERKSVTDDVMTWYQNPRWNQKEVFNGKVDVLMIFLGMNDILQPSIRDDEADISRWLADYSQFVANLRKRCHPRELLFATITPLTADETSPKNRVRAKLNSRLKSLAELLNANIVDFGGVVEELQNLTRTIDDTYRLVPDFVHPNQLGHKALAAEFCSAVGFEEESDELTLSMHDDLRKLMVKEGGRINLMLEPLRINQPQDETFVYNLHFKIDANPFELPVDQAEVKLTLPAGWRVDEPLIIGEAGAFVLRGAPVAAMNTIAAQAVFPNGVTLRASCDIPAAWRVREDDGEWKVHTATCDYTGGQTSGSIDPYAVSFGWQTNTFTAARRVWSEKAREVKAVLSHQGFSQTLDFSVKLNGLPAWQEKLDRNGRNRAEKTLHLKEGWNPLEITCVHHDWQRQFAFDLQPLEGDDLSKLKFDTK